MDVGLGGYGAMMQQAAANPTGEISMEDMAFNSFGLRLADKGLLERGLAIAEQFGVGSKDDIIAQISMFGMMGAMSAETDLQRQLITDAQTAVVEFISNGGELNVAFTAKEPLTLGQFSSGDPEELMELMGDDPLALFDIQISN